MVNFLVINNKTIEVVDFNFKELLKYCSDNYIDMSDINLDEERVLIKQNHVVSAQFPKYYLNDNDPIGIYEL